MGCMPCGLWSRDDFKRIFRKYNLSALGYEIAIWIYLVDGIHLQLESVVWVVSFLHAYDIGLSVDNLLQASAFFAPFPPESSDSNSWSTKPYTLYVITENCGHAPIVIALPRYEEVIL